MSALVKAIYYGGMISYPQDYLIRKLGLNRVTTGWEFLRLKYAKHFGFGLGIKGRAPDFDTIDTLKAAAEQAIQLSLIHYGDMLIDADVRVIEDALDFEDDIEIGYQIDSNLPWDFSKPILIEITYDKKNRSYKIMGAVHSHMIDGVPMALYVFLIHNHLMLGENSLLSRSERTFSVPYDFHKRAVKTPLGQDDWQFLHSFDDSSLIPVGSQIDVTDSHIPKLRRKIAHETGCSISTSTLEVILLALETGTAWATDYIAQGSVNPQGLVDIQKGYNGLGIIRIEVSDQIRKAGPPAQYQWICGILCDASEEMKRERQAKGWASRFYDRYRRIPSPIVNLFDRRINYSEVMAIAGTQIISSNLNGVDFGVPVFVAGITPNDIKYSFIPSHGEHDKTTQIERARRSLETHVTEISFSCGPKTALNDGRSVIYKSLKIYPKKASELLLNWGHAPEKVNTLSLEEKVKQLFIEAYRPEAPAQGRIEKRAAQYLNL
jgi:hypothetical protein